MGIYALGASLNPWRMIQGINTLVTSPPIWAALRYDPCYLESSSGRLSQSQPLWDLAYFCKLGLLPFLVQLPHHSLTWFFFQEHFLINPNEWYLTFTMDSFIQQIFTGLPDSSMCLTMTQTLWMQEESVSEPSVPLRVLQSKGPKSTKLARGESRCPW